MALHVFFSLVFLFVCLPGPPLTKSRILLTRTKNKNKMVAIFPQKNPATK
jgi:hypothetical protein